jgi:release factor glutamine methyltransferase
MPTTTIAQALARAQAQGLARIDAQMLLLHLLGRPVNDRAWLLTHDGDALAPHDGQRYTALCARRAGGEPVAYLTGQKEFWGLPLAVDARVLDPRPDTETLVAWALEVCEGKPLSNRCRRWVASRSQRPRVGNSPRAMPSRSRGCDSPSS